MAVDIEYLLATTNQTKMQLKLSLVFHKAPHKVKYLKRLEEATAEFTITSDEKKLLNDLYNAELEVEGRLN